ncbi:BF3164 family lipoprotein [Parabacteroides provencensis]|uniref:BF3164 family lipoprotein n=1 Tax=Parabacteroides provencensis TaxID=1944636 RepID=UPI0013045C12|nr:BF3164 family lipoprotein [Parabacteroides provencensis]
MIEQYDLGGNLIKRMHGPDYFFSEIKENSKNEHIHISSIPGQSRDAFFCPVVTNDKIYVLYSGAYFSPKQPSYLMKHLFVFNNEGKPIGRYLLDEPIFSFAVDESTNSLYGISDNPEFHVVQFCGLE